MARIPEQFSILNRDFVVEYIDADVLEEMLGVKVYGCVNIEEAAILLAPHPNRDHLEHTYFHELAHCLVKAIGRDDLNEDEPFIDALGGALHQYEKTKTGSTTLKKGKKKDAGSTSERQRTTSRR